MIPAWFRFEHYSPWPNFSFPGFVNARTSPHKNTEHQQRKPSYHESYDRSPTPPQPKTHSSKETSLPKMVYQHHAKNSQKQPTNQQLLVQSLWIYYREIMKDLRVLMFFPAKIGVPNPPSNWERACCLGCHRVL